jgi:DNA-binding transcriptional LysR family regulator
MNLTHVLAFHRVATVGGFTRAARLAGVSQPTLSAQVRQLERTMGAALFERSGGRIRLTVVGELLYRATQRLEGAMTEVEAVLASDRTDVKGGLRIAADSAVHVFPILSEMKRRARGIAFALRIDNSQNVIAQVLSDEADVGVMAKAIDDPRLASLKIREDRLVLLVPAGDSLARLPSVSLGSLGGRDIVMREKGSITREVTVGRLKAAGIQPAQMFDVETREAVREAVAAGFGIGLVFASEAGNDFRLAAVEIEDAGVAVAEYAICRAERRRLGLVARFFETAERLSAAKA